VQRPRIVGPFEGSRAREVLYPNEYSLTCYLKQIAGNKQEQIGPIVNLVDSIQEVATKVETNISETPPTTAAESLPSKKRTLTGFWSFISRKTN
jgi:hypothetical protein